MSGAVPSQASPRDQIYSLVRETVFDRHEGFFVPEGAIDELVNESFILVAFNESPDTTQSRHVEHLVSFTLNQAKNILAIAILDNIVGQKLQIAMKGFMDKGMSDTDLPFDKNTWYGRGLLRQVREPTSDSDDSDSETQCSQSNEELEAIWGLGARHHFLEAQWKFKAPVFSTAVFNYDFQSSHILPFTHQARGESGSFGQVCRYKIHESHFKDPENPVSLGTCWLSLTSHNATNTFAQRAPRVRNMLPSRRSSKASKKSTTRSQSARGKKRQK